MRHLILAAALLAGAAAPAQADSVARLDTGEGKTAVMRWWLMAGEVRWELSCLDDSTDVRPAELFTYRGRAEIEDGFVEGHVGGNYPGRFVLATRGAFPFWQLWLDGCPQKGGSPVIREVR
ncbi:MULTISPECIES: hypothetical protein [Methylobacterium]|uniref:Uncharacterized protein n=1 Tax=Methylobacterium aquaticum TaxID=270351 RepID=A0A0C6FUH7_9HYPH|nr:hypothetical protein [Methylobacterium aquaticum]BAQ49204.1 hypothetical protein Maq22A_1p34725 [Methylobacterium aquaticum]